MLEVKNLGKSFGEQSIYTLVDAPSSIHYFESLEIGKSASPEGAKGAKGNSQSGFHHVLHNISFTAEHGEFIALLGPSGSGKSTLLNILGLIDHPTVGSVTLNGETIDYTNETRLTEIRRTEIGYVFQSFNLLQGLTTVENVAFPLLLQGATGAYERANLMLESVGLGRETRKFPRELSGGQRQRVAVARALVHNPKLLLADEPTGNLDSAAGETVLDLLSGAAHNGTLVIMATHSETASARTKRRIQLFDGAIAGL